MFKDVARKIFTFPIVVYQKLVSPALGKKCIYTPSCSCYCKDAITRHGIAKGSLLSADRLLRCNRLFLGGPDPVPEEFSFRYIRNAHIAFRRRRCRKRK